MTRAAKWRESDSIDRALLATEPDKILFTILHTTIERTLIVLRRTLTIEDKRVCARRGGGERRERKQRGSGRT